MKIKEPANTEEHILAIARRLVLKKGMEATSMADIAREAGINRTLLNYYFRTKDKLFEGIFREILHRFMPRLDKILETQSGIFKKLEMILDVYTEFLSENSDIPLFIANEAARDPEHFFNALKSSPEHLVTFKKARKTIQDAMRSGELRKMPVEYFATAFFGFVLFPFVGKNIICGAFLGGDNSKFNAFVMKRKAFVMESIREIFDPKHS